jgi:hypothetical protein
MQTHVRSHVFTQRRTVPNSAGPAGDPARAAEIIVNTVKRDNPPSHLLLGMTAVEMALDYSKRQLAEATAWENVSRSADYPQPYPAEHSADASALSHAAATRHHTSSAVPPPEVSMADARLE